MPTLICQYGSCMEDVGEAGVVVSLRTATFDGEKQGKFCSASHAAASLAALAKARKEEPAATPRVWRQT